MYSTDIEVFVSHTTAAAVLDVLHPACGAFSHDGELGYGLNAYVSADRLCLTITEGLPDGFTGVMLAGACAWTSDLDFARFLSERLRRPARCCAGADYPDAKWWQPTNFVEISGGKEKLVDWV